MVWTAIPRPVPSLGRRFPSFCVGILILLTISSNSTVVQSIATPKVGIVINGSLVLNYKIPVNTLYKVTCLSNESGLDHFHFYINGVDHNNVVYVPLRQIHGAPKTISYDCSIFANGVHSARSPAIKVNIIAASYTRFAGFITGAICRYRSRILTDQSCLCGENRAFLCVTSPSRSNSSSRCRFSTRSGFYLSDYACYYKPCLNGGSCSVVNDDFVCNCVEGYGGATCETILVEEEADSWTPDNEATAATTVGDILTSSSEFLEREGENVLDSATGVVDSLVGKISSGTNWTEATLVDVTTNILGFVETTFNFMDDSLDCSSSQSDCSSTAEDVYKNMETSLFSLSSSILDKGNAGKKRIQMGDITLECERVVSSPSGSLGLETEGAVIELKPTKDLVNSHVGNRSADHLNVLAITYGADTYSHATTPVAPDGKVINFKIEDDNGNDIPLSVDDPVTLTLSPLADIESNSTNSNISSYNMTLEGMGELDIFVFELNISNTETATLRGRVQNTSLFSPPDFEVTASADGGVVEKVNLIGINFLMNDIDDGVVFKIIAKNLSMLGDHLVISMKFEAASGPSLNDNRYLNAYTLSVIAWDTSQLAWVTPPGVQPLGLNTRYGVRFECNFFGSFSVTRMIIAPIPIDFGEVFGDFAGKVEDSPYVLAVLCTTAIASLFVVIFLRRLDVRDSIMWTYLSLVDNVAHDTWTYTISVHTAIGSTKSMTSVPFFILIGEQGSTYCRVLWDGTRKNFGAGTLSNFVMKTPLWLGDLLSIKIWTGGQGDHPDWLLDRIVIVDCSTKKSFVFLCQDWFSLTKGSGLLCHMLPVLNEDVVGGNVGLGLVSKQKLYSEHLWLSTAKRPTYSTFTRVQRFLCAITLLYLAMLTNAMFYQGDEKTDDGTSTTQSTGLKLGPITIGYREVYVGVISGVIIIFPGFLLTWIFSRRKVKGFDYEESTGNHDNQMENSYKGTRRNKIAASECSQPKGFGQKMVIDDTSTSDLIKIVFSGVFFEQDEGSNRIDHREGAVTTETNTQHRPRLLPWWFIFIGYILTTLIAALSVTFTFIYSLQWGGDTSLQWLLSLFFSTSSSAFFIDPLKIVLISILLSCLFNHFSTSELKIVAPYDEKQTIDAIVSPVPPLVEPPDLDNKVIKNRKRELKLRQRFHDLMKSVAFRTFIAAVIAVICFHNNINMNYRQNKVVERVWGGDKTIKRIETQADIWSWLNVTVVPRILPTTLTSGQPMTAYQRQFIDDMEHYRLGPVRIIQYRVKEMCGKNLDHIPELLQTVTCHVDYSDDDAEERSFHAEWIPCNGTCSQPFSYVAGDRFSLSEKGDMAVYGPGGYQIMLDKGNVQALNSLTDLESKKWIDRLTRGVIVELTVFNANTRLFTQSKALLETSSVGGVMASIITQSARLYPYTTVWDYLVLLLQVIFIITVIVRSCMLASSMLCGPKNKSFTMSNVITLFEMLISWMCLIVYTIRIYFTIEVIERINNQPEIFTSFDVVFLLDEIYIICIGILLFMRILLFLEPLKLNFHLHVMRQTLNSALPQLGGYAVILLCTLTGFASCFYLIRGHATENLRTMFKCFSSLVTVLVGQGKYRIVGGEMEGADLSGDGEVIFRMMYGLFCLGAAIMMINIAITILTTYLTEIKIDGHSRTIRHGGYDSQLNEYMWAKLDSVIKAIFSSSTKQGGVTKPGDSNTGASVDQKEITVL